MKEIKVNLPDNTVSQVRDIAIALNASKSQSVQIGVSLLHKVMEDIGDGTLKIVYPDGVNKVISIDMDIQQRKK